MPAAAGQREVRLEECEMAWLEAQEQLERMLQEG
ncbi:glutathione-regulated potassium-efflux system ATP-binding protein [Klebsiella pneumoniae]|uniref:Glutathione-regulated potassium-efflux system ATP-binding protein n=1 Tax=Klebsiella pneumoniae TaxID=573 RepID=A0A377U3Q7_KLEPN|nr:glutathione-regulated potassium-efflux system ATP-binding protein [Klebsiella pneumoniae]